MAQVNSLVRWQISNTFAGIAIPKFDVSIPTNWHYEFTRNVWYAVTYSTRMPTENCKPGKKWGIKTKALEMQQAI